MRWTFEIQKTDLSLRLLEDLLSGLGYTAIKGMNHTELHSNELESCTEAQEVFEKAKWLRTAFLGAAKIASVFQLGAVVDYSQIPPVRSAFLEVKSGAMTITGCNVTLTVGPPQGLSPNEFIEWEKKESEIKYAADLEHKKTKLEAVYLNSRAEKVLALLDSQEFTGEIVYKIYELIEVSPKNRRSVHKELGILQCDFNRFKDAVHNPVVTGDWARHAYEDNPKTNNPMTKKEAIDFVKNLVGKWLENNKKERT